jgi:hypothetical protein
MTADLPSAAQHKALTPEVTWAQRSSTSDSAKNFIYLTIAAPDVSKSSIKLDVQPTFVNFSGYSDSKKAEYAVKLEFFGEIDPSASHVNHSSRAVEIKLQKKELKEEYWPRLLKDKAKQHYLKTDFDKWVDEDEQDGAADEDLMGGAGGMDEGMMGGMGGGMGGGMPGMGGGAGGMGGLDFSVSISANVDERHRMTNSIAEARWHDGRW